MGIEQSINGVSYGVEVQYHPDPRARRYVRYGWFPMVPEEEGDEWGLDRAQRNLEHAKTEEGIFNPRIVKRVVYVEVVE